MSPQEEKNLDLALSAVDFAVTWVWWRWRFLNATATGSGIEAKEAQRKAMAYRNTLKKAVIDIANESR